MAGADADNTPNCAYFDMIGAKRAWTAVHQNNKLAIGAHPGPSRMVLNLLKLRERLKNEFGPVGDHLLFQSVPVQVRSGRISTLHGRA